MLVYSPPTKKQQQKPVQITRPPGWALKKYTIIKEFTYNEKWKSLSFDMVHLFDWERIFDINKIIFVWPNTFSLMSTQTLTHAYAIITIVRQKRRLEGKQAKKD